MCTHIYYAENILLKRKIYAADYQIEKYQLFLKH